MTTRHKLFERLGSNSVSFDSLKGVEMRGVVFDGDGELPHAVRRTHDRAMNRNGTIWLAVVAMPNHIGERLFEAKVDSEVQFSR